MPLHKPVMVEEALEFLAPRPSDVIVDCTIGAAGHSRRVLQKISGKGRLIGIDKDSRILEFAGKNLKDFSGAVELVPSDFRDIRQILQDKDIAGIDAVLFDLGLSSYQLDSPERGFSFASDGPLDMRMDLSSDLKAKDLVNRFGETELSDIFFRLGEERWHKRIARAIVNTRKQKPIDTTQELVDVILRAVPGSYKKYRIHPATRTFQALRIAVNNELESLEAALKDAIALLKPGGRICVISFHSLEDRIVKRTFKNLAAEGVLEIKTKKPVTPGEDEMRDNPRSRSAKLRAAMKKGN